MESPSQYDHSPNILSLPDELLLAIFSTVKSWRPANNARHVDFASSSRDIANVRLACRRFAAASSHLLVHYVRLDGISPRSLHRLESVARHPLLGRGVRIVRLEALYYAPALAGSLASFALYAADKVLRRALEYKRASDAEVEQAEAQGLEGRERLLRRRAEVGATLEKTKAVLKAWISTSRGDSAEPEVSGEEKQEIERYTRLLRLAHQLYRLRYEEQESLRRNNAFLNRFAAAMARMPKARAFELQDFHHSPQTRQNCEEEEDVAQAGVPDSEDDSNGLTSLVDVESLVGPASWDEGLRRQLGSPPSEVLFALPAAMREAGVRLDRFSVQTSARAEEYYPVLRGVGAGQYGRLASAVGHMGVRSFSFVHGGGGGGGGPQPLASRSAPSPEDAGAFRSYIAAMSGGEGLERLRVVADGGWADGGLDPGHAFGLGDVLAPDAEDASPGAACARVPRPRRRLVDVHLSNVPLRLSELEDLLLVVAAARGGGGGRGGPGAGLDFLTLSRARLVAGTWRQALEVLRRLRVGVKELVEPLGAECGDPAMLRPGRYEAIFRAGPGEGGSAAERFINEELEENPLQEGWQVGSAHSVGEEGVAVTEIVKTQDEDQLSSISDFDEETSVSPDEEYLGYEHAGGTSEEIQ